MSEEALRRIAECKRTKATSLDLSNAGIEGVLPLELGELTWLEELNLRGNSLLDFEQIVLADPNLENQSKAILDSLRHLNNLRSLDLRETLIQDISPLAELRNLEKLWLDGTLIVDLEPLEGLKQLQVLTIGTTLVQDLQPISKLYRLRGLSLANTEVKDIGPLKELTQLESLSLEGTKVEDLKSLEKLTGLVRLYLSNTRVADLLPLQRLTLLQTLWVADTEVTDLSPLRHHPKLNSLIFDSKKIVFPPRYILDLGPKGIHEYLKREARDNQAKLKPQPNWHLKLILIGNSKAGKTSLIRSWMEGVPKYADRSTEWLSFGLWHFDEGDPITISRPEKKGSSSMTKLRGAPTLLVFDFGGQDYYHDAHHLFFSSNTAYVVLWDTEHNRIGRKMDAEGIEQTHYPLNYWLDAIRYHCQLRENRVINWDVIEAVIENPSTTVTFSNVTHEDLDDIGETNDNQNLAESSDSPQEVIEGGSPRIVGVDFPMHALILQSRIDESAMVFPKMDELKARFPWIYDFDAVSMNPDNPARLDLTFSKLKEMISQIPLLGQPLAASWMWVRDALLEDKNEIIVVKFTAFREWANQLIEENAPLFGVAPSKVKSLFFETRETESLLKYLSSLGIVLHYPDVESLRERVFLRPGAIREQVLKVLQMLKTGEGYFTKEEVEAHLETNGNSGLDLDSLLALMQEFKMAFEVSGADSGTWIAPLYLPAKAPAGMEMLLEVFDKPIRRIVYPNFIHKSVTLELFQAFSQDLLPESHQGLASERHIVWRDGMVIRLKDRPEMVLVKFFIGAAATADREAQEAHIEVYAFKTPSGAKPAEEVLKKLGEINHYWDTREEVTVDGRNFVPIEDLLRASRNREPYFISKGMTHALEDFAAFVQIPWKRIFISYAQEDEAFCQALEKHMDPMRKKEKIVLWNKAKLVAGMDRDAEVQRELRRADIVVMLLSADYFYDRDIWKVEMKETLERAARSECTIAWVAVKHCDWESTSLAELVPLYGDRHKNSVVGKPDKDEAWVAVVRSLKVLVAGKRGGGYE